MLAIASIDASISIRYWQFYCWHRQYEFEKLVVRIRLRKRKRWSYDLLWMISVDLDIELLFAEKFVGLSDANYTSEG